MLADAAVIHTTEGDLHLRLFPDHAPKAVENFVGHARSGYFEGVIFHRVIPKFVSVFVFIICAVAHKTRHTLDDSNW